MLKHLDSVWRANDWCIIMVCKVRNGPQVVKVGVAWDDCLYFGFPVFNQLIIRNRLGFYHFSPSKLYNVFSLVFSDFYVVLKVESHVADYGLVVHSYRDHVPSDFIESRNSAYLNSHFS